MYPFFHFIIYILVILYLPLVKVKRSTLLKICSLLRYTTGTTITLFSSQCFALSWVSPYFPSLVFSSASSGTGFFFAAAAAVAASLNVLHPLRCPPFFQWFTWHSRPQYCTVWHNLQGCNGRNGVLGLPQVEQQRMVGMIRPSCLSNI